MKLSPGRLDKIHAEVGGGGGVGAALFFSDSAALIQGPEWFSEARSLRVLLCTYSGIQTPGCSLLV